jgi:hypothetical protein
MATATLGRHGQRRHGPISPGAASPATPWTPSGVSPTSRRCSTTTASSRPPQWLRWAIDLQAVLDARFWDVERGGYFATSDEHEALLVRPKPDYDGAEPSGNAIAILNLLRLAHFTSDLTHHDHAIAALKAFSPSLKASPTAHARLLCALDMALGPSREVITILPTAPNPSAEAPLLDHLRRSFLPNDTLLTLREPLSPDLLALSPASRERPPSTSNQPSTFANTVAASAPSPTSPPSPSTCHRRASAPNPSPTTDRRRGQREEGFKKRFCVRNPSPPQPPLSRKRCEGGARDAVKPLRDGSWGQPRAPDSDAVWTQDTLCKRCKSLDMTCLLPLARLRERGAGG